MRLLAVPVLAASGLCAQVIVSGRVVDETGAGIIGARVELRQAAGGILVPASSDLAGNFSVSLPASGEYVIHAERQGFYVFQENARSFNGASELVITLNHLQEFSERIDVTYSPPAIDPKQPADHRELDNTEIQAVPFPAPQDYRNALPLMNGIVQDPSGRIHVNGGATSQTNYRLNGFNISDPVTGGLDTRVNIETIQTMDLQNSRLAAENGRGSAGVLALKTKMGDDRWRFGGTNFIPGVSAEGGFHVNKWTPRLELSGPIVKGRAWFHNGFDAFYSNDVVNDLPNGQNRTSGISANNLSRFQVNLRPSNIVTASFLLNLSDVTRSGLSFLNPVETTTDRHQVLFMSSIRDQAYFRGGALLDLGFADSRGILTTTPQGTQLYEITPVGNRGNYFVDLDRHFFRQQWLANSFLPTLQMAGTHQLKFGIEFERQAFHQSVIRHDYQVLRVDNSVARYVTFVGSPYQSRKNFEAAQYIQDAWTPRQGLHLELGVRVEWNELVRQVQAGPRFALAWTPGRRQDTKFSAGWGVYYDSISLGTVTRQHDVTSLSTFFLPSGLAGGAVATSFHVNDHALQAPRYRTASFGVEQKVFHGIYLNAGYTHRTGADGFMFVPSAPLSTPEPVAGPNAGQTFQLANSRRDRYDAVDFSLRHTFAGRYEWFLGYTRSSARSNAAVDYSLENPVFGPQASGPYSWDTPNRIHMWGWAPLPGRPLPPSLRFLTRNTTAAYLVEYRTGFPFNIVDEQAFLARPPNSNRLPDYFNINLHFERKFRVRKYLWAWRFGFSNLTRNVNPVTVDNVIGSPRFLTYGRGQARAFSVRLRLLGRK